MAKQPAEGSAAEEKTETAAFEKKEDAGQKPTAADRAKLAANGEARPDGSYPIRNTTELENAVKDWIRTGRSLAVKSWITKRAAAIGAATPAELSTSGKHTSDELSVAKAHLAARGGN